MDMLHSDAIQIACAITDLVNNYKAGKLYFLTSNINYLKESINELETTKNDLEIKTELVDALEGDKQSIVNLKNYTKELHSEGIMVKRERQRGHNPSFAKLFELISIDVMVPLTNYIIEVEKMGNKVFEVVTNRDNNYTYLNESLETLKEYVTNLEKYIKALLNYQKEVDIAHNILANNKPLTKASLNALYSNINRKEELDVMFTALTVYGWEPKWVEKYLANSTLDHTLMKRLVDYCDSNLTENTLKRHLKYLQCLPR